MAGIYIHVPFCARRCAYCDFYSQTDRSLTEDYVRALLQEMDLRKDYSRGERVETVYLGGGTPSLLGERELTAIFEGLERHFGLSACREITIEANPDDLRPAYIALLRRLPINRVSMGIQSFHDDDLRLLNRRHNAHQAQEAVANCQAAGLANLSIDLIYGLPGQTLERWEANLEAALALDVPHLSAYHLTYESGTPLERALREGRIQAVDEETSLSLFNRLIDRLEAAGYVHYEISNFARPHREALHNSGYWADAPYLGLGPSAHSYDRESRQWNVASLPAYLAALLRPDGQPLFERERLTPRDRYDDYIITRTRTRRGLSPTEILAQFGPAYHAHFQRQARRAVARGLLMTDGDRLRLTRTGLFISDSVMVDLLAE